ncbi:MAG TPA: AI-2E family transporter [Anaeromyxobacter sp.]|nr:AI-2E family transporter [Anaeromyxobacter sp.]
MAPDQPLWRRPRARLLAVTVLVWALVVVLAVLAAPVSLPFLLAALAAYVIDPIIARLSTLTARRRRLPRWAAVLVVYVVLGLMVWLVAVSVLPQLYREVVRGLAELRDFLAGVTPERLDEWARSIDAFLRRYGIPIDVVPGDGDTGARFSVDLAAGIADALHDASAGLRGRVGDVVALSRTLLSGALRTVFFVILLFMLTAFLSMDAPRIVRYVESLVPRGHRADFDRLLRGIDAGLSGVVRGQLTIMLVNGALTLIGLLILKVPFAFALAFLATILYVVPIFGTILSSLPIVLLALTSGGLPRGLLALGWISGIHALESYVLNPKILGDAARIHPVLIVLALVVGERTAGVTGALLAAPVMSVFVAVFRFLHRKLDELDDRSAAQPDRTLPAAPAPATTAPIEKGRDVS